MTDEHKLHDNTMCRSAHVEQEEHASCMSDALEDEVCEHMTLLDQTTVANSEHETIEESEHEAIEESEQDAIEESKHGLLATADTCIGISGDSNEAHYERPVCCCLYNLTFKRNTTPVASYPTLRYCRNRNEDKSGCKRCIKFQNDRRTSETVITSVYSDLHCCRTKTRIHLKTSNSNNNNNSSNNKSNNYIHSISGDVTKVILQECQHLKCHAHLRRSTIMRWIIYFCVLVTIVCVCAGVIAANRTPGKSNSHKGSHWPHSGLMAVNGSRNVVSSQVILDRPFKSVSRTDFENHLAHSRSAAEMLKIFFDDSNMSDETVNTIMLMKSNPRLHGAAGWRGTDHTMIGDEAHTQEQYREQAFQHNQEMYMNPLTMCRDPRPEVVPVESTELTSIRSYYPSCTVVHRCRNTGGCCPPGTVCRPKKQNGIEIIEKRFLVFERSFGERIQPMRKNFVETKTFINHTACECHRLISETNCGKACPMQFTKRRTSKDCECICQKSNKLCRRMHLGRAHLAEKDLECIKKEDCIKPKCFRGEFKINTGFCPHYIYSRPHRG